MVVIASQPRAVCPLRRPGQSARAASRPYRAASSPRGGGGTDRHLRQQTANHPWHGAKGPYAYIELTIDDVRYDLRP
jgi:hypothetical protein